MAAVLVIAIFPLWAKAADKSKTTAKDWLVVPVFYATNRAYAGQGSKLGPMEYTEEPNGKGLLFGVKNIAVPVPSELPVDVATQSKMLWQKVSLSPKQKEGPPAIDANQCTIKDGLLDREQVVSAFNAYKNDTGSKESVLFVHGCCINFDTAMQRSAAIAATMQTPVLLYDWVSPRKFRNYLVNGTRADQTMDDFCKFLTQVEKVADPTSTVLVAHSMGNEFIDQAMIRRYAHYSGANTTPPKFREIVLSNADLDAQSFLNHASQVAANAEKVRVYFTINDPRLRLSTFMHGGFKRLGCPGDLLSKLCHIDGLQMVDVTEADLGHEMPCWIVADLHRQGNIDSAKDFQFDLMPEGYLRLKKVVGTTPVKVGEAMPNGR
jgi:esterase/lipase superfamily enzyme